MATSLPETRFLDPNVLARIDNLELIARTVVEGISNGLHKSPFLGLSLDFAEHRAYMPGDDIRRIDWRLYARTDRHYVKQFEADTNVNAMFLLDVSKSMGYGSGPLSKLDYGRIVAACLAYFCRKQGDRVGLHTFDSSIVESVKPSARHLDLVLQALERADAGAAGALEKPLRMIAEHLHRRSLVIILSDLYEEPAIVAKSVGSLRAAGHDVVVFHLLDEAELDFPFDQPGSFQDLESGDRMSLIPDDLREEYRNVIQAHIAELQKLLSHARVDYRLLDTRTPLDYALFQYLSWRERTTRVR